VKAKEEAREAYQYQLKAFEPAIVDQAGPIFIFTRAQQQEDEDGFQRVGAKRPRLARGRPPLLSVAGRDPSQSRSSLGPGTLL